MPPDPLEPFLVSQSASNYSFGRDFALSSRNSATVSAFIMNVFIAELNVFHLSSGPRQRNKSIY